MIGAKLSNWYEILRELGYGGMGVVYLARDPLLERDVAVKKVSQKVLDPAWVERLKREARVSARMDHPAIVPVFDIGEHEGSLYFVMPFVPGTNLRSCLESGSLLVGDVIELGIQVAEALDYSHSQGVVHRDIKPENLMIQRLDTGEIRVRILDFGLARASFEDRLTRPGAMVGTVLYFSPEQAKAEDIDGRTDIYALGTVLYECFTGRPPFTGEAQSVLYRIVHEKPHPPRASGVNIDQELQSILMQCLEKDPARRPQHAKEVADALARYHAHLRETDLARTQVMLSQIATTDGTTGPLLRPVQSVFVGREKEFAELQQRLNLALSGECQFVMVGGDAGVGKSRLLDELENLAKVRKIRVIHGRFAEQDRAFPYQGFCEAIQEFFQLKASSSSSAPVDFSDLAMDLATLFPVLAEMKIGAGPKGPSPGESRRQEDRTYVFDLLARSFIRIGNGKPLVVLFEDLHNVDVSIEALEYVVRRLGPTPTLVVGTYRTTEVDKRHPLNQLLDGFRGDRRFQTLHLQPYSAAEHRSFLERILNDSRLNESLVVRLYEASEGNAYFTQELVRSLLDSEGLIKDETGRLKLTSDAAITSGALPSTIQQVIERRVKRLPEELRELLCIASVVGKTFEYRDLEVLADSRAGIDDALDQLVRAGLLQEERESRGDRLMFSSAVLRDVLYAELPRRKRRTLHRKYAEELTRRFQGRLERVYPQLLHHFSNADVPEKVVEFGMKFARTSLDNFGAEDAARAVRTVLDFLGDESEVVQPSLEGEARVLLAEAARMTGNIDNALNELELAIKIFERQKETVHLVGAIVQLAETAWEGRRFEEARRWVDKGIGLARNANDSESLKRLLSLGATVASLRADYDKAKTYLQEIERGSPSTEKPEAATPPGGKLIIPLSVPVRFFHPADHQIVEEGEILSNVFETLVSTDEHGHLVPFLCQQWEVLEQGRSFLFDLRPDVKMHDGRTLTAQDVKASMEKSILRSRDRLPAAFMAISEVFKYLEGSAKEVGGIRACADFRLAIDLKEPLPIYPALLTDLAAAVACEAVKATARTGFVGTGPFQLKSFEADQVVLERNPKYWNGAPPLLDEIVFKSGVSSAQMALGLKSGEFDLARGLLPEDLDEALRDPALRPGFVEIPKKNVYSVCFNTNSPVGGITALRQALCGCVQTHDLVWRSLGRFALPAEGLLPPGILGHDPGRRRVLVPGHRIQELFESTGLTLPIQLTASVHPILQDRYSSLLHLLFKEWAALGVYLNICTPDMNSYMASWEDNRGIDLNIFRWLADYDDPDNFTFGLFDSSIGELRKYFSSNETDRIIADARAETRPSTRERIYREFEERLLEEGVLLPLFHEVDYRIAGPKVRQLRLRSNQPFVNYSSLGKVEEARAVSTRKGGGGIVYVPDPARLEHLDPSIGNLIVEGETHSNIFETLTRDTGEARIVPWLASDFEAIEGGRRFKFRLREGIHFHDGRRLTSRDVRYSFERLLRKRNSINRSLLSSIRGSEALLHDEPGGLTGFRILSATEFEIELDQPLSLFPALLTHTATAIVPEGTTELKENWRSGCVGTGPFRVLHFERGQRLELEANPNYWRKGFPKCERLVFIFGLSPQQMLSGFRSGAYSLAYDLLPADVESLRRDPAAGAKYREIPSLSTYYIAFNIHQGPLADEALRLRLVQAVDVEQLIRRTLGRLGIPAYGLIPPGLLGHEPTHRNSAARVQKERGKTDKELLAVVHPVYQGTHSTLMRGLFETLAESGLRVKMVGAVGDSRTLGTDAAHLLLNRWIADYPDPDAFAYGLLDSQAGMVGHFCGSAETDQLILKGRSETDSKVRHSIYRQMEEHILAKGLLLPLFHEQTYRFARPEIEGLEVGFSFPTVAYEKIWVAS